MAAVDDEKRSKVTKEMKIEAASEAFLTLLFMKSSHKGFKPMLRERLFVGRGKIPEDAIRSVTDHDGVSKATVVQCHHEESPTEKV
jgi:hypothetical protein